MTKRWTHPWWGHLPAAVTLVGFVAYRLASLGTWPERVPLGYGFDGVSRTWGSPWILFALITGLGLTFLALSFLIDELWALQESRKRFNPLTLLDDLVIGMLVGAQLPFLRDASQGAVAMSFPWPSVLACAGGVVLVAVLLEWARPFLATPDDIAEPQLAAFRAAVEERVARGESVVFWDIQNPRYVTVLSLGVAVVLWVGAGVTFASSWGATVVLGAVGGALLLFYGGQRTRVTRDGISIRYGLFGIRVFRCSIDEITAISLRTFAPLREFGGYGIRFSRSTVAYYLAGRRGVQIERCGKIAALIGSDHPERLAAVLSAVSGHQIEASRESTEVT